MRDAFELARDAGVNLAFLGGNDGFRNVTYADNRTAIVVHQFFRDMQTSRPECELLGVEWQGGWVGDGIEPGSTPGGGPYVPSETYSVNPQALNEPWFNGTGFTATSTIPGIVGYEWDGIEPGCAPQPTVLLQYSGMAWTRTQTAPWQHGTFVSTQADAVTYTAPSGATVFSAGSIEFSWGLDGYAGRFNKTMASPDLYPPDPRLQRFMRNLLDDLSARPPSLS